MTTLNQLKGMAKELGVTNYSRLRKSDLIRVIQVAEGHSPCFHHIPDCGQIDCLFYAECVEDRASSPS
ncbi:MAG: Rho termination factor N-terminal domain-containing protein [Proteobacteria bacterium]|nr:Rho termination factor N-terminal domain-containing protein [Pseudomonadota bacterium]MBU1740951.1 Rho termination factor N-terminal domain-containing protein [Pseudomonadota bacterium]